MLGWNVGAGHAVTLQWHTNWAQWLFELLSYLSLNLSANTLIHAEGLVFCPPHTKEPIILWATHWMSSSCSSWRCCSVHRCHLVVLVQLVTPVVLRTTSPFSPDLLTSWQHSLIRFWFLTVLLVQTTASLVQQWENKSHNEDDCLHISWLWFQLHLQKPNYLESVLC